MKTLFKIIGIMIGVIIVVFVSFLVFMNWGREKVIATSINDVDLNTIGDGKYTGTFNGYRWSNTVEVSVLDHKITNIKFVQGQTFRDTEFENKLISNVIDEQSIEIDVIAGSTVSSKAILKAIENALGE